MKLKLFLLSFAVISSLFSLSISAQTYAITNARVVTVSGDTIEKGTVVIRNGLIESVGASAKAPADAQVFDGTGLTVYPGFFDALTNLGVSGPVRPAAVTPPVPGGAATVTAVQAAAPQSNSIYPAGLRPEETVEIDLRAGETQFDTNRNAGFTTVLTVGRTGIFNGQSAVINLAGESVSAMVIKSPFAEHVTFTTVGGGQYPGSLLGTFSAMRQMFLDAQRLREINRIYAENPRGIARPASDRSLEALIPLLNRQIPVVFNANRENEIVRALDFAKEFNLKAIIAGGQEAWKVADRLKAQDVPVFLSLNFPKRTTSASPEADVETMDLLRFRAETPKAAARLAQAGVKVAFQSGGMASMNDFLSNAGKAVENGMNKDTAVRSMTLTTAELLGVNDRLGSIETGKIANLTVIKGDIFGKDKFISHVFVDGKLFEQKEPAKPAAGGRPGAATPVVTTPAVAAVAGNYNITIEVPGQTLTGTLALIQQGNTLTGSMQTQLGTTPVNDGKVTAEGFSFAGTIEFGGSTIDILVKGTVNGNQIAGTVDSPQGTIPFSGTRNP